jgi:hypothetical protein
LIDPNERLDKLLDRMDEVDQEEFLEEHKLLSLILLDEVKVYRFRHHRADYLAELEVRWEVATAQIKSQVV